MHRKVRLLHQLHVFLAGDFCCAQSVVKFTNLLDFHWLLRWRLTRGVRKLHSARIAAKEGDAFEQFATETIGEQCRSTSSGAV